VTSFGVYLTWIGTNPVGLCPFHDDRARCPIASPDRPSAGSSKDRASDSVMPSNCRAPIIPLEAGADRVTHRNSTAKRASPEALPNLTSRGLAQAEATERFQPGIADQTDEIARRCPGRYLLASCERGPSRQMIAVIASGGSPASVALHKAQSFHDAGTLHAVGRQSASGSTRRSCRTRLAVATGPAPLRLPLAERAPLAHCLTMVPSGLRTSPQPPFRLPRRPSFVP
jgi:hypothetical protein